MISGRCTQTIRLVSDFSKFFINNYNKRRREIPECIVTSYKLLHPVSSILNQTMSSSSSDMGNKNSQNKLAFEKSPYLLQHANNPVDWYPWGNEALEKARAEDKIIFLSVGYSTCHWCHVMERESFENPDIAKIMNKYFVNIKVDREERPDIDKVYMTFVQSISGHGGWPMSVFLTPDLNPISGGTYFPPTDKYGQPGFKRVLESIAHKWMEHKEEFKKSSSTILRVLKQSTEPKSSSEGDVPPIKCADICTKQLINGFDTKFGGFSRAPKFPQPVNLNLLFLMYARDSTGEMGKKCLDMCVHTLTKMARGGIHDHVGQGFARYSVDGKWHVPHFEKMLYDQAQILRSYSEAYQATKDEYFAEIINDIVTYVTRDLHHPEGGFYSAEDADSLPTYESTEKQEGAFYVWTFYEIELLLDKVINPEGITLSDVFCYHFDVKPKGNVMPQQDPHGELLEKNVLINFGSEAETAEHFKISLHEIKSYLKEALNILYEERKKRPRPHLDDKMITAWNGLMISGLAHAAAALDNPSYASYAESAASFIERYLYDKSSKTLLRSCYKDEKNQIINTNTPISGFQVDYAFVIRGLIDLYEVTFDCKWLELAEELQDSQDKMFWDTEHGGYYSTTTEDGSVILRLREDQDGAEPSGNSVACGNLVRLASYLSRSDLLQKAEKLLISMREMLQELPAACPELVTALVNLVDSTTQIYIAGSKDAEDTKNLLRVVRERLIPGKVIMLAEGEGTENILYKKNEVISKLKMIDGSATAYVCQRRVCSLPITAPDQLASMLAKLKQDGPNAELSI